MKLICATTIASALMVLGVHGGAVRPQYSCDGMLCYDGSKGFICNHRNFDCCKGQGENNWQIRASSPGRTCCSGSGKLYLQSREVCVNGKIRPKQIPSEHECGQTATYNADKEECCKRNETFGRVYRKGGVCCNETYLTDSDLDCCEGVIYNKTTQTCCPENGVHRLTHIPNGACCLDVAFNPITQKCVDGITVVPKNDAEIPTCGQEYYNNATHQCCDDQVLKLSTHICYQGKIPVPKMNTEDDQACLTRDNIYITFHSTPNNRRACIYKDRVVYLEPNQEVCSEAPEGVYDTEIHLCCGGMVYHPYGAQVGKKCCENRTNAYNPATETCCYNKINRGISENDGSRCCERQAYNPKTDMCSPSKAIVPAECPDSRLPPYAERCDLTRIQIQKLRESFHSGGLSVYVANVTSQIKKKRGMRQWQLEEVEKLASADAKRKNKSSGKIKIKNVSGTAIVKARECQCPYQLISGERYIIFAAKPMKRGKITLHVKAHSLSGPSDAVISLANAGRLGNWIQILFGKFNNY